MNRKIKIGLIDGLPFRTFNSVITVDNPEINYPWDSELFGVPDYRAHADEMIGVIRKENSDSEILVFPFYPKFNSARKNYILIAKNLAKAIDSKCQIICICLEVLDTKYLSAELLKTYKHAHERGIIICVSAGNNKPFLNPLIHKKYTIPVIGITKNIQIWQHPEYLKGQALNAVSVYSNRYGKANFTNKTSCSTATAAFAGCLSYLIKENSSKNSLSEVQNLFKKNTNEKNHHITFFNI